MGVLQGAILSPTLYSAHIDGLPRLIARNAAGIKALMYVDDIALIADTAEELAKMLETC